MVQISWALEHTQPSILHRDIKTENVMIGDGQVFLIDWGVVVDLLDKESTITTTNHW